MNRQLYLLTSHKNGWRIVEAGVPISRHHSPNGRVNISLGNMREIEEYLDFSNVLFTYISNIPYYLEDDIIKLSSIKEGHKEIFNSLFTDFNIEWWEK